MRLYLTSYQMGDESERLLAMAGRGARVAVISNALDFIPADARRAFAERGGFQADAWFRSHGLDAFDLDLRELFGRPDTAEKALEHTDLAWAVGGNAFLLLRAMRQSGLEPVLKRRLNDDSLMYGGWSAGACVAGTTLRGLDLMDDPEVISDGYRPEPEWDGLGLVQFAIVPHFDSDHTEAQAASLTVAQFDAAGVPFKALRDGESIIVDS